MGDSDKRRHSTVKHKAEYRRIGKYYKSVYRYKGELARRKRVLELQNKGLTIKQTAVLLGVGERTVKRDLAKAMPFLVRRQKQQLNALS
jgi:Fic family protein